MYESTRNDILGNMNLYQHRRKEFKSRNLRRKFVYFLYSHIKFVYKYST